MFGGDWSGRSRDIAHLIFHVNLKNRMIKWSCDFMGARSSSYEMFLSHDLTRPRDSRVMWFYGWDPLIVGYTTAKFGGHILRVSGEIMFLVCHLILRWWRHQHVLIHEYLGISWNHQFTVPKSWTRLKEKREEKEGEQKEHEQLQSIMASHKRN